MKRLAFLVPLVLLGCDNDKPGPDNRATPPPPPATASARADVCAGGGGQVNDPVSGAFFGRAVAGFCVDPQGEAKTYGDKGKLSMDEVCTTAFDGECEVYKRFALERVVTLRYVDGSGAPTSVEVVLSRFKTADGAYAMFTKRVVADGDPLDASVRPLAAGAAGAIGKSNAYVWKAQHLVELTFVTEDRKMTADQIAAASDRATSAIAKDVGSKLPGGDEMLPAAKALPAAGMIPLGISYVPKDALGVAGLGPAAIGYYKEGDKRWRMVALAGEADQARDAFKAIRGKPGALPLKNVGDDAALIVIQEAPDRPKAEYVFARKAAVVAGVGDEELVLKTNEPADKQAPLKLTKDEKLAKLNAWLASAAIPANTKR